uniref:Uncharacterized protein n=1 Tax=Thermogemmatispora argillosa TaxID=2045280 RepID=A0A455SYH9_9CHLR|nr:hypothetical protein KTA_04100 [Thermogemmatispora argillosa]
MASGGPQLAPCDWGEPIPGPAEALPLPAGARSFHQFNPATRAGHAHPFPDDDREGQALRDANADEDAGGRERDEPVISGQTETGSQPAASAQLPLAETSRLTTTA